MIATELRLSPKDMMRLHVTDDYSIHRVAYGLFEDVRSKDQKESAPSGFLYVDKGMVAGYRRILLLSDRSPQVPEYGTLNVKKVPDAFLTHTVYRFELVVNAVTKQGHKCLPVKGREEILRWFSGKSSESWGFETVQADVRKVRVAQIRKSEQRVTIQMAEIVGVLRVSDRQLFQKGFRLGIGRAKAFGCGLLQIVPIA